MLRDDGWRLVLHGQVPRCSGLVLDIVAVVILAVLALKSPEVDSTPGGLNTNQPKPSATFRARWRRPLFRIESPIPINHVAPHPNLFFPGQLTLISHPGSYARGQLTSSATLYEERACTSKAAMSANKILR